MKILVTGGSGFIGQDLVYELFTSGHEIYVLTRNKKRAAESLDLPVNFIEYSEDADTLTLPKVSFSGVINLAGENISGKRWSASVKKRLRSSRVDGSERLIRALKENQKQKLQFAITASAIGYYPNNTEEFCDESHAPGEGFLANLVSDWEAVWQKQDIAERLVILRFGVVLGRHGGAGKQLKSIFQWGLGGRIGKGDQPFSWIHKGDLISIVLKSIEDHRYEGPINCVSPQVVDNRELTKTLAKQLGRPAVLPAPSSVIKLVLGEMATIIVDGQKVMPKRLKELSFSFSFASLEEALKDLYGSKPVGLDGGLVRCEVFSAKQYIERPLDKVFQFFSDPHNLEKITPPLLKFKIDNLSPGPVKEGTEINYTLKIHGIPVKWKTEILNWNENQSFVDTQRKGPYKTWHHTHRFVPVRNGTMMTDEVYYKVPLGFLGNQLLEPYIRKDIEKIFAFRREAFKDLLA